MTAFLTLLLPGMLWILFFRFAVKKGNIFAFLGWLGRNWLREFEIKPLWGCTICMASLHGLFVFFATSWLGLHEFAPQIVLFYCPCLSGLMVVYHGVFEKKSLFIENE